MSFQMVFQARLIWDMCESGHSTEKLQTRGEMLLSNDKRESNKHDIILLQVYGHNQSSFQIITFEIDLPMASEKPDKPEGKKSRWVSEKDVPLFIFLLSSPKAFQKVDKKME